MTTDHTLHIARVVHWPGRGVLVLEALLRGLNRNIPRRWLLVSMYDLGHAKTERSKSYFMILPRAPRIRRTNHISFNQLTALSRHHCQLAGSSVPECVSSPNKPAEKLTPEANPRDPVPET